jgi:hypothetical protein
MADWMGHWMEYLSGNQMVVKKVEQKVFQLAGCSAIQMAATKVDQMASRTGRWLGIRKVVSKAE